VSCCFAVVLQCVQRSVLSYIWIVRKSADEGNFVGPVAALVILSGVLEQRLKGPALRMRRSLFAASFFCLAGFCGFLSVASVVV